MAAPFSRYRPTFEVQGDTSYDTMHRVYIYESESDSRDVQVYVNTLRHRIVCGTEYFCFR